MREVKTEEECQTQIQAVWLGGILGAITGLIVWLIYTYLK